MRAVCLILAAAGLGLAAEAHVFSMSCKVNALNGAFTTEEGRTQAVAYFRRHHVTKLWLESYRHLVQVPVERLVEARDYFNEQGFETCGLVTPTQLNDNQQMVTCWTDPKGCARLAEECAKAASVFDCVIMDDFLMTDCTCSHCQEAQRKSGLGWSAFRCQLMMNVCSNYVIAAGRLVNPKVQFIVKYPCWHNDYRTKGYDPLPETELFGACWVGTETRDANPNPIQACWIVDWMDKMTKGKCGGGWYDPLDSKPEKFVEQARYTILGGAKESLIHCYDYLASGDPGTTPFGESTEGGPACAVALLAEIDGLKILADTLDGVPRGAYVMQADGVSRHAFSKGGVRYVAYQNTTDEPKSETLAFVGEKVLLLPSDADATVEDDRIELAPHALVLVRERPSAYESSVWYDARMSAYTEWPSDMVLAYGGVWAVENLDGVARMCEPGVLAIDAESELSFLARRSRMPGRNIRTAVIETEVDFELYASDSLPEVMPEWKGGAIVVREATGSRYYGLVRDGAVNVWRPLDGPDPLPGGRTTTLRMTFADTTDGPCVTYEIGGVMCSYAGNARIPILAKTPLTGVSYGGHGLVKSLMANAELLPGLKLIVR